MMQRHGWSLVATGNLAVVLTVALASSPVFGRLDPGRAGAARGCWRASCRRRCSACWRWA
jgi:hypothetical protein